MRENLFRGKRTDNGEWICSGNLIHFNEDNEYYIPVANSKCTCTHDENDNIVEWDEVMFCKVIPETIGQYTGLTNKNGKKIFEGDIVLFSFYNNKKKQAFSIKFVKGEFLATPKKITREIWAIRISSYSHEFEVIGNIYDNIKLLKGGDEE